MKFRVLLLSFALLSCWARGQTPPSQNITSTSAPNNCATIGVDPAHSSTVTIQVTGTWSATLQPEISLHGKAAANTQVTPSTSSTAQATITANGIYTAIVAGADLFLLCATSYSSGTAVVDLNVSSGIAVNQLGGGGGGGGSGTVTSVGLTVNSTSPSGVFTVTGSPVTTSGTLNINLAGTSGGVGYFSSATVFSSSGAMASGQFMLGGGAGSAPTTSFSIVPIANGGTATGSTLTGIVRGGNPFTASEISGDGTTSGSNALTVTKLNGGTFPTSAAVVGSDASAKPIAATAHGVGAPLQCADTSASATTYTCTTTPNLGALTAGDAFIFSAINQNNSGSATLNIDGIGAKTLKKWQNAQSLAAGDLQLNGSALVVYDGTNLEVETIGNPPAAGGSVTSVTFTGDGTVLSSTPSAAVTTSGTLTATLANAAANSVLGNPTGSAAAPSYTVAPVLGIAGTSVGTLGLQNATSGKITISPPTGALGTVTNTLQAAADTFVYKATTDTLTNKTISGSSNTLSNIGNSSLTNSAITIAGTSVSLGGSTSSFPSPGAIGGTTAAAGSFTTLTGSTFLSTTKCAAAGTAANPSVASCSAAPTGSFSCATNASTGTCTINTTAMTSSSAVFVQPDSSLGTLLSVTCNTTADTGLTAPRVSARSNGTSFTITLGTFSTNPLCFNYWIVN